MKRTLLAAALIAGSIGCQPASASDEDTRLHRVLFESIVTMHNTLKMASNRECNKGLYAFDITSNHLEGADYNLPIEEFVESVDYFLSDGVHRMIPEGGIVLDIIVPNAIVYYYISHQYGVDFDDARHSATEVYLGNNICNDFLVE